jgi:hypothetical protein
MGDTFIFSNFAVSTLLYELGNNQTTLNLITDDAWRFPANLGGSKVPCVISDDSREPEIVYITLWDPVTGLATVERGREGTTAKNWLAGTLVRHTLTAETFQAIARVNPLGQWSPALQYVASDLVLHNDISYIATRPNINSEPTGSGNADWQALYIPPGVSAQIMNWQGQWSNATGYETGGVVVYDGQIWVAMTDNTNVEPTWAAPQWHSIAPWGGTHRYAPVLTATGTANYNVSLAPDVDPPALYDGMRLRIRMSNDNVGACTLKAGALPEYPLRVRSGQGALDNDFRANDIYEVTFFESTSEWLVETVPEVWRRFKIGDDLDAMYKPDIADNKKTKWPLGENDAEYVDPAELDWPYPETERGSLELRLMRLERALGLYKKHATEDKPLWTEPWEPGQILINADGSAIYPNNSLIDQIGEMQQTATSRWNDYQTKALVSLQKRNRQNDHGVPPTGSQDVGLGAFVVGLTQAVSYPGVRDLHSMELWYIRRDGTSNITSGS